MNPNAIKVGWNVIELKDDEISIAYFNGKILPTTIITITRTQFNLLMNSNSKLIQQVELLDKPNNNWSWDRLATYTRTNGSNPTLIGAVANKAGINHFSAIDLIATWKV